MEIEFKRLTEVDKNEIILLMNNQLVRRQMPLLKGNFTKKKCDRFIASKEQLWLKNGYGPWAFIINNEFAGWGGVQEESGEADLAMVLHPDFWGVGKVLYVKILNWAFNEMKLESITILLPPSRIRIKGLFNLGFIKEDILKIKEEQFIRYRLINNIKNDVIKTE